MVLERPREGAVRTPQFDTEPHPPAHHVAVAAQNPRQMVAYFSFVDRLALGLGVEQEDYWRREEVLGREGDEPPG